LSILAHQGRHFALNFDYLRKNAKCLFKAY